MQSFSQVPFDVFDYTITIKNGVFINYMYYFHDFCNFIIKRLWEQGEE